MSDRRTSVKLGFLFGPLLALVLTLHAWGDVLAGGLGRAVVGWQYPERVHGPFLVRVPRRSDADGFAVRALEDFVSQAVKVYGSSLGLHAPAAPVQVVLLDPETDPRRFGWNAAEDLKENEGLFDANHRTIVVRMERKLQQDLIIAALRHSAARLLLHDAGAARWSPWLTEGLIGRLEGSRSADLRAWTGDLPSINDLLTSRETEYRGANAALYARGARLLVAFLMESMPEGFASYFEAERMGSPAPQAWFTERFPEPDRGEGRWREWLHAQK
jgi:hypothetical protein